MIQSPLVSIIMPAYNVDQYIDDAINSVLAQYHRNWELLVVNNNSTDNTLKKIQNYKDSRIKVFEEKSQGVGFARNRGLTEMKGEYFCFLDADDVYPPNSISSRLEIFAGDPNLTFVDGRVEYIKENMNPTGKVFKPSFNGNPFQRLLRLSSSCLFGPSWMVKKNPEQNYAFETDMSHAEDLFFYLTISSEGFYSYTNEIILFYRQRAGSAMSDILGLENGYVLLIKKIKERFKVGYGSIFWLKIKIGKIMFLSHIFDGNSFIKGIRAPFNILFA